MSANENARNSRPIRSLDSDQFDVELEGGVGGDDASGPGGPVRVAWRANQNGFFAN